MCPERSQRKPRQGCAGQGWVQHAAKPWISAIERVHSEMARLSDPSSNVSFDGRLTRPERAAAASVLAPNLPSRLAAA